MRTIHLFLYQGERLIEALKRCGYEFIPSNVVLDKTLPGIGATYTEIHSMRNSIIIEPNVPVIKGKVKKHSNLALLGIYKGVSIKQIEKYLSDTTVKHKKLITTPEGFNKIMKAAENINLDLFSDFFCLFDECERITQDVGYRKNISNPVKVFFKFKNKAFVSATPLEIHHTEIEKQGFEILKIEPQYKYKKDIQLIVTNDVVNILSEHLFELRNSKCICIFFNSTKGIGSVVDSLQLSDYKIFCSEDSAKRLIDLGFENVETEFCLPLAQFNFFTSRFFSAVDIELKTKPDIIIYTDLKEAEHTIIDPFSEAIQIQGRFRTIFEDGKNYNSLTHITNYKDEMNVKSVEELDKEIKFYHTHHKYLTEELEKTNCTVVSKAVNKEIKNASFSRLLDLEGDIDEFAIHNLYNEEREKGYYTSTDKIKDAYIQTHFFNIINFKKDLRFNLEDARLSIKRTEGKKKKIARLVSLLQTSPDIEALGKAVSSDFEEVKLITDAFKKLGGDYIISVNYSLPKIKSKLNMFDSDRKRFCPEIILEIMDSFELDVKLSKDTYKERMQEIYTRYGIIQKVTQKTIMDYFEVSPDNSVSPPTFTLKRFIGVAGMLSKDKY